MLKFGFWTPEFIVILATLILVFLTSVVWPRYKGWKQNKLPKIRFTINRQPDFDGKDAEDLVPRLTVPSGNNRLLYFCVQVTDARLYRNNHAWIRFPLEIEVNHNIKYDTLEWGKRATARTKHEIGYDIELPLTKKQDLDAVYLPVVVNIPKVNKDYTITIQFWSESVQSKPVYDSVKIHVTDSEFTENLKYFDHRNYIIRDS